MRAPVILSVFRTALKAWWDDDASRLGASLAYYTLFAIAPVLLVATAIAGMVFGAEAVRGEIVGQLDQLIGREGAHAVQSLLEGASQRRAGMVATLVGSIAFVVAATGAFLGMNRWMPTQKMSLRQ
jgi:membrane protein